MTAEIMFQGLVVAHTSVTALNTKHCAQVRVKKIKPSSSLLTLLEVAEKGLPMGRNARTQSFIISNVYPESFLRIRKHSKCIARIGKTNTWRCYSLLKCIAIFGGSEIETWICCLAINGMQQFTRLLYFFPRSCL